MIIIKALVSSFALAWWTLCALGNFWFARETWRSKRIGTISKRGDTLYDSMRIASLFAFTTAGLLSVYLIWQTWQYVRVL